jgi:hypothetical protein
MKKEKKLMVEFINNMCEKDYSSARKSLSAVMDEKIKGRIRNATVASEEKA